MEKEGKHIALPCNRCATHTILGDLKKEGKYSDLHCNRCAKTITLDGYSSVLPPKNVIRPSLKKLELLGESIFSRGVRLVNFAKIYFWASPFFEGCQVGNH